ncbi:MAG: hypothetical protein WCE21_05205 [Candidatus Babeliales bacterium]
MSYKLLVLSVLFGFTIANAMEEEAPKGSRKEFYAKHNSLNYDLKKMDEEAKKYLEEFLKKNNDSWSEANIPTIKDYKQFTEKYKEEEEIIKYEAVLRLANSFMQEVENLRQEYEADSSNTEKKSPAA